MKTLPAQPVPLPPDPAGFAAVDRFVRATRRARKIDLIRARALRVIQATKVFKLEGCASAVELGARHGVRPWVMRDLLALGDLLERRPDLEERFLDGGLSLRSAATLQQILETPGEPEQPWIDRALDLSTRDFCGEVKDRLAERRIGRPPVDLHLRISAGGFDDLRRARVLIQRKRGRFVSNDEASEVCFGDFVDRHDPDRVEGRTRRMPDTRGVPGRTVPREVGREVRHRDRRRCAVPSCPNEVYVELGHFEAHADGGSREADNLFCICSTHNQMMEQGLLIVRGTAEAPEFFDREGRPYTEGGRPRRRPPPRRKRHTRRGHAPGEPPKKPPASASSSAEEEPEP